MGDLASIITAFANQRGQATQDWAATRRATALRRQGSVLGAVQDFGEIPSLLRRKQADDEEKSVGQAFMGSYSLDGDPEGAFRAVQMLAPTLRSREGIGAALRLTLQADTLKKQHAATQLLKEKDDLAKERRAFIGRTMSTPVPQGEQIPDQGAMMGMASVDPSAPPMMQPMGMPSAQQGQAAYLGSGYADPSELNAVATNDRLMQTAEMSAQDKADAERGRMARASLTDARTRDIATQHDEAHAVHDAAYMKHQIELARMNNESREGIAARSQDQKAKSDGEKLALAKAIHDDALVTQAQHLDYLKKAKEADAEHQDANEKRLYLTGSVDIATKYLVAARKQLGIDKALNKDADWKPQEDALDEMEKDVEAQMEKLKALGNAPSREPVFRDEPAPVAKKVTPGMSWQEFAGEKK